MADEKKPENVEPSNDDARDKEPPKVRLRDAIYNTWLRRARAR